MATERESVLGAFENAASRALVLSLSGGAFAVEPIGGAGSILAAVDGSGTWGIAIKARRGGQPVPPIHLANLTAEFGVACKLDLGGEVVSATVALLQCQTDERAVRSLFATFVAAVVDELPAEPTDGDVVAVLDRWISLFLHLQSPPRNTVIGLIGELVVIDSAADTTAWVAAWHSSHLDLIDFGFTMPQLEVEVKATSGRERVHTVSIHQSSEEEIGSRYFASLMVEIRDTGLSVGELSRSIADRLPDADARRKFWVTLADVCGQELGDFLASRFIIETSVRSLQLFAAADVPTPSVELPLPAGVSDLRYRSDFSSVAPVPLDSILTRA